MNYKGQAAITDALFFLMIVTVLSTMLYAAALHYAVPLLDSSTKRYYDIFTASALKTFYLSDVPLDSSKISLEDSNLNEPMLFKIKLDYYRDSEISKDLKKQILMDLNNILKPLKSKSFLFYIIYYDNSSNVPIERIAFLGMSTIKKENSGSKRVFLVCNDSISYDDLIKYISDHSLGQNIAEGKLALIEKAPSNDILHIATTALIIWTSVPDINSEGVFINDYGTISLNGVSSNCNII